jgi:endo-1,4-beta-xylanase
MRTALLLAAFLLAANVDPGLGADAKALKPADKLPRVKELPNPFRFADGSSVRTRADWKRRRQELKDLFQDYEYGHLPPKPKKMTLRRGKVVVDKENKVAIEDVDLLLEHAGKKLTLHFRLAWPDKAKKAVPVVIQSWFGLRGFGDRGGRPSGRWFAPYTKRGYGVAQCYFQEMAPDNKMRTTGVYRLFGNKIDCGALMAWAWGVHRVLDAVEKVDRFDAKKAIVTGHSRWGKAALVAGAFDDRIALTVPSHSGCAGTAPFRFIYGKSEQLHNIVGAFPYWFHPNFNQFKGKVERLPVDQHLLMALVAPRALLQTEGTKDSWTNPQGAQLTHQAARKVYTFLKAEDKISIRFRPVGHIPSIDDMLDFADAVFSQKRLGKDFGKLPYPKEKKAMSWDVPK